MGLRRSHSGKKVIKNMGRTITTKRIALALGLVVATATAFGQQPTVVSTRIATIPAGLNVQVTVDGQTLVTPVTLLWPAGSRHVLRGYDQLDTTHTTQWQFGGFISNRGPVVSTDPTAASVVVTADPDISEIDMQISVTFL